MRIVRNVLLLAVVSLMGVVFVTLGNRFEPRLAPALRTARSPCKALAHFPGAALTRSGSLNIIRRILTCRSITRPSAAAQE